MKIITVTGGTYFPATIYYTRKVLLEFFLHIIFYFLYMPENNFLLDAYIHTSIL